MNDLPIVIAITGASGAAYARRLLEATTWAGTDVYLTVSPSAAQVFQQELNVVLDLRAANSANWQEIAPKADHHRISYFDYKDYFSPLASGSSRTRGMIVCPCSGSTLSGIATGASRNLAHRAAEVHLKEKRPLVIVPRETPLSLIYLENLTTVAKAGATILPAMPGFYHHPRSIDDLVDFIVARILDHVGIEHQLIQRWAEESEEGHV